MDFDFYEPIKTALNFLHDATPSGAIIMVDDYDFFSTGVKTAVDEFIKERNSAGAIYDVLIPNTQFGHCATSSQERGNYGHQYRQHKRRSLLGMSLGIHLQRDGRGGAEHGQERLPAGWNPSV